MLWTSQATTFSVIFKSKKAGLYSHYDHDKVREPSQPSGEHILFIHVGNNPKSPSATASPSAEIGQR